MNVAFAVLLKPNIPQVAELWTRLSSSAAKIVDLLRAARSHAQQNFMYLDGRADSNEHIPVCGQDNYTSKALVGWSIPN